MKDLSSALERLRVAFATPTDGLGAPGPAEEGDKDMGDADGTERATPPEEAQTPPTKRLKGFVAASQKATSQANSAGGRKTRVLQAGGPPRPVSSPSSVGGHLAERHHGGGGLPVSQVCWEEPHGGPGDPHLGGVRPDEDPAPPGGGVGFAVPEEQGVYRRPAHVQARRRSFRLQVHVQGMRNGVARGSQAVLGLPRQGVRPLPGTLGHL